MQTTVTVTSQALDNILSLPLWGDDNVCTLQAGDDLEVVGVVTRTDENNIQYLKVKSGENKFYVRADLFDFDIEAYNAEIAADYENRELQRMAVRLERDRQEFLEHYNWNDLRCKAAVGAMQAILSNATYLAAIDESNADRLTTIVADAVTHATALVNKLKETV